MSSRSFPKSSSGNFIFSLLKIKIKNHSNSQAANSHGYLVYWNVSENYQFRGGEKDRSRGWTVLMPERVTEVAVAK